ncbi:MAG: signal recognition particle-docking protein FtsY [Epsilonproteobacteria bacterium]|nr:signal recognition particle-docking protein FtsY [Campylobacterota bacterium]
MFKWIKDKLSKGLEKTGEAIKSIIPEKKEKYDKDTIEEILIVSDVEYDLVEKILNNLPKEITRDKLKKELNKIFEDLQPYQPIQAKPFVELIIGVNGAGKTTTIAKLAQKYKNENKKVLLGAADTFRAAAIEQLKAWAQKLDIPIIATKQGHDASAVAFDTINSAKAKDFDNVIIDTAGRLHTQVNLANELKKIVRVANKAMQGAPHRKILIIDGTQGNSAIEQAKAFHEMVGVDGIIVTKLDGTAKGGAIFSIVNELKLPIFYIGVGERSDDLIEFNKDDFIETILNEIFKENV